MKKYIGILGICALAVFATAGFASAATINLASGTTIHLGASNVLINGTCFTASTTYVPIILTQGGNSTQVALATTPDNSRTENFRGFGNFPLSVDDGFTTGPATLTAVCAEGNASVTITLIDPDPATSNNNTNNNTNNNASNNTSNTTSNTTSSNTTGTVSNSTTPSGGVSAGSASVAASSTPTGGVAAGRSDISLFTWAAIILMIVGAGGLIIVGTSKEQLQMD